MQQNADVVKSFIHAINDQDVEAMVDLMSTQHRFIDGLGSTLEGRDTMREAWRGYFGMVPDYELVPEQMIVAGDVVAVFGSAHGTYSEDGELRKENWWEVPWACRATVQDGSITEWRIYCDNDPIRQIMERSTED